MNHKQLTSLNDTQNLAELGAFCAKECACEVLISKKPSRIPNRRNKSRKVEKILLKLMTTKNGKHKCGNRGTARLHCVLSCSVFMCFVCLSHKKKLFSLRA